ncbi:MAG TPA: bifunctional tRNA (5-methylaminomethyl-2-thiouridine)(34)-methyltransferase MnmD/FAD-dependent 5-carboxymethylaminomethyl-2-thiouridine(34) oxidoreductase MnmC [Usitatibacter sp.]|nr:bifunctional tRNA (5-methylaminomethyl-2-thiouridine)(34)-methyltransferase MnmD/FAD-dependent 5-carboxymethylaminomethyl-2-thiouridine(34) oxidoreductase MnmC [Usitatibacter sp.]
MITVPNAVLERSASGVAFSSEFQDIYHSSHGGLAQARHVFLRGNGLPERWRGRGAFTILETGFGLGLNFLAAWDAWRTDPQRPRRLHFVSVEHRPLTREDLTGALAPFEELAPLARALSAAWPPPIAGFHRAHFDGGNVILTLLLGGADAILPQLRARADALFLDGFSPARNPGLWSPGIVRELARLCAPDATLATWTVAGGVRAALADAGFHVDRREGFAAKREMLVGRREAPAEPVGSTDRRAIVVGAGLAGTLVAERLAARDWTVDLVDARAHRSVAAAGLVRPIANLRDAGNAQVSRSAYLYALQHYRNLQLDGYHLECERCGVLQLADGADEAARFEAIARSHGYPDAFLAYVDGAQASDLAKRAVRGPGWWFPQGSVVSPQSLAVASLARAGARVRRTEGRRVERLEREAAAWRALDGEGRVVAEAPVLVVANAFDARRLLPGARLSLSAVRGQVTYAPADARRGLDIVVSGTGYVAPMPGGGHCIGASYQHDDMDPGVRAADHVENLARAESMLPGFTAWLDPSMLEGWTGFRTTVPDRLPIFGATVAEGVHVATGLGSRGLLWGPLGAELLACQLSGEPLPLGRDHAGTISPRRFLS